MNKEEILTMLKVYFKDLALDWQSDNICLIDDYLDLEHLAIYISEGGQWILNYVDVKFGEPLGEVEDRCFDGWEPFAVTQVNIGEKPPEMYGFGTIHHAERFWFKKRVKRD